MVQQSQGPTASIPAGGIHGTSHEVLGRLAVGGMAELYLARTTLSDGRHEIVVLKRILPHLSEDPEFVRMFRDEAFLAATLDHPNIVRVHDIGQDGEDYFFTMEYVHGENVRTIIKAAQKLEVEFPLPLVVQIGVGVCRGLHYAHEQKEEDGSPLNIVHRDVSPTNIIVSYDGELKIVDFGIAKAAAATHVTQAGMLKGKASYMSPEQCRAQPVDRRSDVFAIGILLYEMSTLTRLFRGENELAVLHQILTGDIESPSQRLGRAFDPDLERIIMRALSPKPEDRFPTAAIMQQQLEAYAAQRGHQASEAELGEFLRDLCGDKPYPWVDDDEVEPDEFDELDVSGTGMPTTAGNFDDDEEDTMVNRRAPDPNLRTMVPGGRAPWPGEEDTTGTTNRRLVPAGSGSSRPGALRVGGGPSAPPLPRPDPSFQPPTGTPSSATVPDTGHARRPTATPVDSTARPAPRGAPRGPVATPSPPYARTGATTAPIDPGRPAQPNPFNPRSGRTLAGAGGGLAGPLPPRSGRTVTGENKVGAMIPGRSPLPSTVNTARPPSRGGAQNPPAPPASPSAPSTVNTALPPSFGTDRTMAAGAGSGPVSRPAMPRPSPAGGGADRTVAVGAGSRPRPPAGNVARPARGPSAPSSAPHRAPTPTPPRQPADSGDQTMALTPEQARELARLGKAAAPPPTGPSSSPSSIGGSAQPPPGWSTPSRAPSTPSTPPASAPPPAAASDADEGGRTMAISPEDAKKLAELGRRASPPKGPVGWNNEDPLTSTQPTPISGSPAAEISLTSTQRAPTSMPPSSASAGGDLRRPQMRSPAPRPENAPRSMWLPIVVIVVLLVVGAGAWVVLSGNSPF
ncbi:MAG: protein kinase [Myxococcota bacterium]